MPNSSKAPSWKSVRFFREAIAAHDEVTSVTDRGDNVYVLNRKKHPPVVVFLTDIYTVGMADLVDAKAKIPDLNCIVTISNWNGYTMSDSMKTIQGYHLIKPEDLSWRPSNLMKIPNADYLERTGSENLGARLWRLPPKSANTLHKHIRQEEFYFVLEGTGRLRVGDETLTVPRYGGVLVGPDQLRQVFNDTDAEVLWLIIGAPEELEFLPGAKTKPDMSLIYPTDPTQLPKELAGVEWPPKS
jgi:mannose-6-phosphate isomerase-like protein (cupin superfamily)